MAYRSNQSSKVIEQAFQMGAALILFFWMRSQAHAVDISGPHDAEIGSLPPYCQVKLNPKSPNREIEMWNKTLGRRTYGSLHHYCFALNYMNRYRRTIGSERGTLRSFAINDFNYVLQDPDLRSPLIPEMYLNRGQALRSARQDAEAIRDYYKAIELNPKLVRAYSELADYFAAKALTAKALEIVTQGLRHLPDNKVMQRNYTKYGGKLPYPEPLVRPEEKPAAEPMAATGQPEESKPVVKPSTVTPMPPSGATEKVTPDSSLPTPEQAPPTKDTDKSPWCRFCPE